MAVRIPTEDAAPRLASEDAVHCVFRFLGSMPDFRDPGGSRSSSRGSSRRRSSPRWTDAAPMTKRSMAVDCAARIAPHRLVTGPP
jgi:hypothetical protein